MDLSLVFDQNKSISPSTFAVLLRDASCVLSRQRSSIVPTRASCSCNFISILKNPAKSSDRVKTEITKLTKCSELQRPKLGLESTIAQRSEVGDRNRDKNKCSLSVGNVSANLVTDKWPLTRTRSDHDIFRITHCVTQLKAFQIHWLTPKKI